MSNPYAPAKQNTPNVYDSAPSHNPGPTPDPEEVLPGEGSPDPVSPEPSPDPTVPVGEDPVLTEEVPVGTISEVTEWVGEDKDRAALALEAEKNSANPRKTLVATLEGILSDS